MPAARLWSPESPRPSHTGRSPRETSAYRCAVTEPYRKLDLLKYRDDLSGMPRDVADVLDEWLHRAHGVVSGRHHVGLLLDLLYDRGYAIEPLPVAGARSYTTIETLEIDRSTDYGGGLTESQIVAEDPTWQRPDDPDAPVRSLG